MSRFGEERVIWEIDERARTIEGLDADGRPRPEYAASLGLIRAPFGRRVLATIIEALVLLLVQTPMLVVVLPALLTVALDPDPVAALAGRDDIVLLIVLGAVSWALSTAFVLVQLILLGRRGVTLGKAFTGLRAVNVRTLERPGFWRGAVVRYLVLCASLVVPLVGPLLVIALSPLFDRDRRGRSWPDLAAAIWLVDVRRGLHPYDEKRMRIARKTVSTDLLDVKTELPSLATPRVSSGSEAYVPLARNKGGVLGAVRSRPGNPVVGETGDEAAEEPRPGIPTTVAATPFAAAARPQTPAPAAAAIAPGAIVDPGPGAAAWTPPPLLEDRVPDPGPAPAASPAAESEPEPAPTAVPAAEPEPAPAAAAPAPHPVTVELTLDSGETVTVGGGGVVLGRAPGTGPDDVEVTPVPVVDPTRSISKTHWALLRHDDRAVAVERGSTNGSVLVRGGSEQPLEPGRPVEVRHGDTIRFGDRHAVVTIR
ncbi:RDD family protein [Microbacterium oleivorans]|uniref:RDD family protein n=1 Tax=Microbacterium oleivorans TaxID=273677 RepID=A0A7D5EW81_9MICO|nr:RDD family protein [Microbacterium oleivorans]QLD11346.1 RDD family protein [Microbacterium oleivorans]